MTTITYTTLSQEEKEKIKRLYLEENLTIISISRTMNRNPETIRRYLLSHNLYLRRQNEILLEFKEEPLTKRETEIYNLLLKGYNPTQISQQLNISITTVRTHILHILSKKGCSSQVGLLVKRIQELENENTPKPTSNE